MLYVMWVAAGKENAWVRRWVWRLDRERRREGFGAGSGTASASVSASWGPEVGAFGGELESALGTSEEGRFRFLDFAGWLVVLSEEGFSLRESEGKERAGTPSRPTIPLPEHEGSSRIAVTLAKRASFGSRARKSWPGRTVIAFEVLVRETVSFRVFERFKSRSTA